MHCAAVPRSVVLCCPVLRSGLLTVFFFFRFQKPTKSGRQLDEKPNTHRFQLHLRFTTPATKTTLKPYDVFVEKPGNKPSDWSVCDVQFMIWFRPIGCSEFHDEIGFEIACANINHKVEN